MGLFRSETMIHKNLRMPLEYVHQIMNAIGQVEDGLEFVDLNKSTMETLKPFNSIIVRCEELEKSFAKFEGVCKEKRIPFKTYRSYELFNAHLDRDIANRDKVTGLDYFDLVETEVFEDEKEINEHIKISEEAKLSFLSLLEEKSIVEKLSLMFNTGEIAKESGDMESESALRYIAGICSSADEIKVERITFRMSKGRAIPCFFNIDLEKIKAYTNNPAEKKMFVIIVQGNLLKEKILKMLTIFNCHIYQIPNPEEIPSILAKTQKELQAKEKLIYESERTFIQFLLQKSGNSKDAVSLYGLYVNYIKREKLIYKNINRCLIQGNFVTGEVWIPKLKFDLIQNELQSLLKAHEEILPHSFYPADTVSDEKPPTYFKDNDFFFPFQEIVNTYGVPRYKEINPALYTIISFPFLFGIMFGDIGHGLLLFAASLYLCLSKERIMQSESSSLKPLIRVRYLLVFMGFFSFYGGLMYNDFMAIPTSFFNSCYQTDRISGITTKVEGCVYPIGFDPKWYAASNELTFTNSFKMKFSVVIGVLQMTMGIILRGMNNRYFKDTVGFYFEFIPQLIFMTSIFGYMIVLIYIKWATNWAGREYMAPSIITTLMGIALKSGSVENKPLWGSVPVEETVNRYLLYVAILCVPIILFPRPILALSSASKQAKVEDKLKEALITKSDDKAAVEVHHHSFSDVFVEQCISTIEFVLGTISNTASYLRLWALSLAHAQLSHVFLNKTLLDFAKGGSIVFVTIGFFFFANATVGVLMGMDLMESFLHTLRLHWVEFQSKFYYSDGYKYTPFSFKQLIEQE